MSEVIKKLKKDDKISSEEYENLLEQYQFSAKELSPGKLLKGKVIKVTPSHVLVDVGSKSEGIIPLDEFGDTKDLNTLNPDDEIEAILIRSNLEEGYLLLSRKKAIAEKALDNLETAFMRDNWIVGKITEKLKNGYSVNVGIDTFLPDSHADIRPVKNPEKLIGNVYKFKVIKFDRRSENAVVSRKLLLQDEREKRKKRVFDQLSKGKHLKGKVKSLTNFGAFIDLGGIEGLLHISDMSWGKINHPSELLEQGQEVEVIVLDFDEKEEKISLGYKQLSPDPWQDIDSKYQTGQKIAGKVVSLTDFGAFVELEEGVEGLVHISDLTWSRKLVHPKKILSVGEDVTVSILDLNSSTKRISLGLKQVNPHPLEVFKEKYSPGSRIKGTITSITDFGAFMEVEKGIEGLIHISDISWEKIKHPSDKLKIGEEVEAVVLNIDVKKQKLSLGIKQLEGDIWEDFFNRQKTGDLVNVKVVRIASFGLFVEITPGIEGVVFLSELDEKKIDDPAESFTLGEKRLAKIIKLNQKENKISLSFKQAQVELQKMEYQKFVRSQNDRHTLGDIMKDQLKNIKTPLKSPNKKAAKKEKKDDKS
ncbi:MAG: 30S ribosomal protein S1 [Candidatus Aminicenantes bacterium]|nr:30S ribosomal protein S1 [Candidatus Aminicenantes bacterium]